MANQTNARFVPGHVLCKMAEAYKKITSQSTSIPLLKHDRTVHMLQCNAVFIWVQGGGGTDVHSSDKGQQFSKGGCVLPGSLIPPALGPRFSIASRSSKVIK